MKATVRIAPVERWCDFYKPPSGKEDLAAKLVGVPVEIYPATMRPAQCQEQARMWDAADESWDRLDIILSGHPRRPKPFGRGICEHVLEMD